MHKELFARVVSVLLWRGFKQGLLPKSGDVLSCYKGSGDVELGTWQLLLLARANPIL